MCLAKRGYAKNNKGTGTGLLSGSYGGLMCSRTVVGGAAARMHPWLEHNCCPFSYSCFPHSPFAFVLACVKGHTTSNIFGVDL